MFGIGAVKRVDKDNVQVNMEVDFNKLSDGLRMSSCEQGVVVVVLFKFRK